MCATALIDKSVPVQTRDRETRRFCEAKFEGAYANRCVRSGLNFSEFSPHLVLKIAVTSLRLEDNP